jgi:hypothetical protein
MAMTSETDPRFTDTVSQRVWKDIVPRLQLDAATNDVEQFNLSFDEILVPFLIKGLTERPEFTKAEREVLKGLKNSVQTLWSQMLRLSKKEGFPNVIDFADHEMTERPGKFRVADYKDAWLPEALRMTEERFRAGEFSYNAAKDRKSSRLRKFLILLLQFETALRTLETLPPKPPHRSPMVLRDRFVRALLEFWETTPAGQRVSCIHGKAPSEFVDILEIIDRYLPLQLKFQNRRSMSRAAAKAIRARQDT